MLKTLTIAPSYMRMLTEKSETKIYVKPIVKQLKILGQQLHYAQLWDDFDWREVHIAAFVQIADRLCRVWSDMTAGQIFHFIQSRTFT